MLNKLKKIAKKMDEFENSVYESQTKMTIAVCITVTFFFALAYLFAALKYGVQ